MQAQLQPAILWSETKQKQKNTLYANKEVYPRFNNSRIICCIPGILQKR